MTVDHDRWQYPGCPFLADRASADRPTPGGGRLRNEADAAMDGLSEAVGLISQVRPCRDASTSSTDAAMHLHADTAPRAGPATAVGHQPGIPLLGVGMRFLVLNRTPLIQRRYDRFFGDAHEVVLITDAAAVPADAEERDAVLAGYAHVEIVKDFHFNADVELLALELHEKWGFERLIAVSEFDLLRGARLRTFMGIAGQSPHDVTAFRDKFAMKSILQEAGVPVLPFAAVTHATDLLGFVVEHGYPLVVKPRRGGGSMDIEVLRSPDDLPELLARHPELGTDDGGQLLVETYLDHELFHIDGVLRGGEVQLVWPSSQGDTTCLDIRQGRSIRSALMDPEDPLAEPLREMTLKALAALPAPDDCVFHAEVFRDQGGKAGLVFNEIAARMGGGLIEEMIELGFGVRLPEFHIRSLSANNPPLLPERPLRMAGLMLFPPRPGTLVDVPDRCPVPGVSAYNQHAKPGTVLTGALLSTEKIASVLVTGTSRQDVERILAEVHDWFHEHTVIADPA
ncbi:hypothetical protein ACIQZN_25150 [Streptomyces sp. NPDC097595]|uniref:ATP-binding protein n=1 Tax=Streptomyces sp. NPDC097595 TaxID=3366090 RepID=UPI003804ECBA